MPHRSPEYREIWLRMEAALMPTLLPFASEKGLTLPPMGPYPRFFLERDLPGDNRWVDLSLLRTWPIGLTVCSDDLPLSLRAGRLKQIRREQTVCAYQALCVAFDEVPLHLVLPRLRAALEECWTTVDSWSDEDLARIGDPIPVPSRLVVV